MVKESTSALNDDLNIAGALGALYRLIRKINPYEKTKSITSADADLILSAVKKLDEVIACLDLSAQEDTTPDKINSLIALRDDARSNKDWALADRLRDELLEMGLEIMDTPQGARWTKKK